jgi:N-methylhydantoinase A
MYRIGIDVGGTFTDFVITDERNGDTFFHKVPSTPSDPSEAIGNGIEGLLTMRRIHRVTQFVASMWPARRSPLSRSPR